MQKTNKNAIRKDIAALIDGIKASSDRIGFRKDISQAELDLIIHQIEQLYRKSVVFAYLNTLPDTDDVVVAPSAQHLSHHEVNVEPIVPEVVQPLEAVSQEKVVVSEPETNLQPVIEQQPIIQDPPVVKVEQPAAAPPPIRPDLRKAIGLNERIMFTRLLFKHDQSAYEECINQLSACTSRDEARAFLDMLAGTYNWNKQSDEVQTFYTIVKNRF